MERPDYLASLAEFLPVLSEHRILVASMHETVWCVSPQHSLSISVTTYYSLYPFKHITQWRLNIDVQLFMLGSLQGKIRQSLCEVEFLWTLATGISSSTKEVRMNSFRSLVALWLSVSFIELPGRRNSKRFTDTPYRFHQEKCTVWNRSSLSSTEDGSRLSKISSLPNDALSLS
jgi:hypothetical protein